MVKAREYNKINRYIDRNNLSFSGTSFMSLQNEIMAMSGVTNYVREYRNPWAVTHTTTPGDLEMNVYLGHSKGNYIMPSNH